MAEKKESFFWTSYSDLMTSLFFVMLLLFIMTIALTHNAVVRLENEKIATEQELNKIKELQEAVKKIDTRYFEYDSKFKRHTLKRISVSFKPASSDIYDISNSDRCKLESAGRAIEYFLRDVKKTMPNAEYLVIIEGQSSLDRYPHNDELSYKRALALYNYWKKKGITFKGLPCEVLVSGSGCNSKFRIKPERVSKFKKGKRYYVANEKNQRFVIHIIPKPGDFN